MYCLVTELYATEKYVFVFISEGLSYDILYNKIRARTYPSTDFFHLLHIAVLDVPRNDFPIIKLAIGGILRDLCVFHRLVILNNQFVVQRPHPFPRHFYIGERFVIAPLGVGAFSLGKYEYSHS